MYYSSFEEGFRDMYPRLVRTLMVASSNRELASDIAQEALAKAFVHWKKVNSLELPLGWVRKVSINLLRDEFRKKSRQKTEPHDPGSSIALATLESIERSLPTPMAIDFARALEKLPEQQRIAATLAYVDDCSEREIAQCMGISQGSVKTHLHHARKSLSNTNLFHDE